MLKVLQINDYPPPPEAGGGAEVMLGITIRLLRERNVHVELFTSKDLADPRLTPWRYIDNRAARTSLSAKLDAIRPDVVHLHNFYHRLSPGILAALAAHRRQRAMRVVMTAHDYHLACPNSGGSWFRGRNAPSQLIDPAQIQAWSYLLTRRWDHRGALHSLLKLAQHIWNYRVHDRRREIDLVLCPSRFVEEVVKLAGVRTLYVPHPTAAMPRHPAHADRPDDHLHLIFAGRIEPEKGLAEFLAIAPIDIPWRMTVIGDGSETSRCREMGANRGIADRMEFTGRLPHEAAISAIAQAHVLVLPSLCLENYPMSLIEALAAGTNILTSDLGGMREIVETARVGWTFAPSDTSSLAQAMRHIDAERRAGRVNAFDVSAFLADRTEEAHARLLMQAYQ